MPSTVKKPMSEPSVTIPLLRKTAITPPTRANGRVKNDRVASRQLRNEAWSSR